MPDTIGKAVNNELMPVIGVCCNQIIFTSIVYFTGVPDTVIPLNELANDTIPDANEGKEDIINVFEFNVSKYFYRSIQD